MKYKLSAPSSLGVSTFLIRREELKWTHHVLSYLAKIRYNDAVSHTEPSGGVAGGGGQATITIIVCESEVSQNLAVLIS